MSADGPGTRFLRSLPKSSAASAAGDLAAIVAAAPHAAALSGTPTVKVPTLIGFGGYARSGKDTTAEILVRDYGHRLLSFGTYVASLLVEVNPLVEVSPGQVERAATLMERLGYEGAKRVPDFVRLLQDLGTGINRRDAGLWARLVLADLPPDGLGVITGVRSLGQIAAIRDHGGLTIWVQRPGIEPRNGHINELEVGPADFDVVLNNDGSLADLAVSLRTVLTSAV